MRILEGSLTPPAIELGSDRDHFSISRPIVALISTNHSTLGAQMPPADNDAAMLDSAWGSLLVALQRSADALTAPNGATNSLELAEGYRFITRVLSASLDMVLENADSSRPEFTRLMTPTRKFFGDNPDTYYDYAPIKGNQRYEIIGNRGTCLYLSFCAYGRDSSGTNQILASANDEDMSLTPNEDFRIILDIEQPPNALGTKWLEMTPEIDSLIVRQYFLDRETETPATYTITALEDLGPPEPTSPRRIARRIEEVGGFTQLGTEISAAMAKELSDGTTNIFSFSSAENAAAFYPTPDNLYVAGWYQLGDNQALEITGIPPETRYWSILLMSRWMESLDYRNHQIILNHSDIVLEPDGSYKIFIAGENPGHANWLDTAGHNSGYMMFRWMRSEMGESPKCRVIELPN